MCSGQSDTNNKCNGHWKKEAWGLYIIQTCQGELVGVEKLQQERSYSNNLHFLSANRTMDLSLRDALGGGGGGVPGGAPAEALLKRDFVATLEKDSYDDKVGETVSKSDYRPLLDGKDTKGGKLP